MTLGKIAKDNKGGKEADVAGGHDVHSDPNTNCSYCVKLVRTSQALAWPDSSLT